MKPILWVGLVLLVLGVASLMIPIPHAERHGIQVGDVSLGVTTHHDDKIPTAASIGMILGGLAVMAIGSQRSA